MRTCKSIEACLAAHSSCPLVYAPPQPHQRPTATPPRLLLGRLLLRFSFAAPAANGSKRCCSPLPPAPPRLVQNAARSPWRRRSRWADGPSRTRGAAASPRWKTDRSGRNHTALRFRIAHCGGGFRPRAHAHATTRRDDGHGGILRCGAQQAGESRRALEDARLHGGNAMLSTPLRDVQHATAPAFGASWLRLHSPGAELCGVHTRRGGLPPLENGQKRAQSHRASFPHCGGGFRPHACSSRAATRWPYRHGALQGATS